MAFIQDDAVFPSYITGLRSEGFVCEAAAQDTKKDGKGEDAPAPEKTDAPASNSDAVEEFASQQARTQAMSAVLAWVEDGEYTYTALDEFVYGVSDLDGDFEISDEEEAVYNAIWQQVPDALATLGANNEDINELVNSESDDAAERIGKTLAAEMESNGADDEELIVGFAMGSDAVMENAADDAEGRAMVLEATYKKRKVVRDGKVTVVRKRISGKVRLSAAQKAALRKARRKANTSAAKLARRKAVRIRKRRGL